MKTPEDTFNALKKDTFENANSTWDLLYTEFHFSWKDFQGDFYKKTGWEVREFQREYQRRWLKNRGRPN